jgi:hypothetical protein
MKAGVVVHRATAPVTVNGKSYPAGSYVVKAAQAFRAHVMDMFEPQDHPDDIPYPGGPPKPPYDATGYTLAYSMGVKFDRVLDAFDGPFEKLADVIPPPAGKVAQTPSGGGYFLSHQTNDAFVAVNRLLKNNEEVYWIKAPFTANGRTYPAGTMFIPEKASTAAVVQKVAADKGLAFDAAARPSTEMMKLKPVRIGLWDQYGGSTPEISALSTTCSCSSQAAFPSRERPAAAAAATPATPSDDSLRRTRFPPSIAIASDR